MAEQTPKNTPLLILAGSVLFTGHNLSVTKGRLHVSLWFGHQGLPPAVFQQISAGVVDVGYYDAFNNILVQSKWNI